MVRAENEGCAMAEEGERKTNVLGTQTKVSDFISRAMNTLKDYDQGDGPLRFGL